LEIREIPELPEIREIPKIGEFPEIREIPELPEIREIPKIGEFPEIREIPKIGEIPKIRKIPELPEIGEIPKITKKFELLHVEAEINAKLMKIEKLQAALNAEAMATVRRQEVLVLCAQRELAKVTNIHGLNNGQLTKLLLERDDIMAMLSTLEAALGENKANLLEFDASLRSRNIDISH
jgi:hypothetical protein